MGGFDGDNKNYHFKGEKAYTEDDVLVHNIFVYKIPRSVSEEEVFKYFSNYGEVVKIHLMADKKRSRRAAPRVAFVNFVDPLAAFKVLQKTLHSVQGKRFHVKACDSWHQPTVQKKQDNGSTQNSLSKQSDTPTLLQLNDDCLELICKKLKLRDQVRFSLTCQRFCNVFQMGCKAEYKTTLLEKLEGMTLWEIREFFRLAGPNVETLAGSVPSKDRERILEFVSLFCGNVKRINLDSGKIKTQSLQKIFEKLSKVTDLQLHDCSLKDNAILAMKKLPKLEVLHLTENYELTGNYLSALKNLKELNLYGCGNLQASHIINMLQHLTELRVLNIQRCERINSFVFDAMSRCCNKLEVLKMSCPEAPYECVAHLPRLKHLEVAMLSPFMPVQRQLFAALAKHKNQQLEYLHVAAKNCINTDVATHIARLKQLKTLICPNNDQLNDECLRKFGDLENLEELVLKDCRSITNDGLLFLLRKCTKLRRINLQLCNNVTDIFILKALDILKGMRKSEESKRKEPLLIYATKSGISEFLAENVKNIEGGTLMKISFLVPLSMSLDEDDILGMLEFMDEEVDGEFDIEDDVDLLNAIDEHHHFYDDIYDEYSSDEDEDFHHAYNLFGRYEPYGHDSNDYIW